MSKLHRFLFLLALTAAVFLPSAHLHADWTTHRGNAARTGNTDGLPGPTQPRVLWVHTAKEQFIASPVAEGRALFVCALGAFNSGLVAALDSAPQAKKRELWTKRPPTLKQPVVCSPAIAHGKLVFGDGMHQTSGAVMRCLQAKTGSPLWQLAVPGNLVHMESTPLIEHGRVYFGAGHGGVFCVELDQATLEGKSYSEQEIQQLLAARWKELQARYESEKKKDPDFAIPPTEEDLPKPSPVVVWTQGQGAWHVDAPLAAVGDKLLVCSSFLDVEKSGKRALLCLNMTDGKLLWEAPLRLNSWSGATVAGDAAIVACSNIRYEEKELPRARGELLAVALADGSTRWKKALPGAVIGSVAVLGKQAVFAGTDGKLRAVDAASGDSLWQYDAQAPFFAAPAIAGGIVYVADLKGWAHAVALADGKPLWKLHVTADPVVKNRGKFYGSPIVHGGRVYLATCELDAAGGATQAVICLGDN